MSTLISDLDSSPGQDGDFVQNILNEMNGGAQQGGSAQGGGVIQLPPALSGSHTPMVNAPNPNTVAPMVMDNGPITAHMIGNSHPTPADFAHMMNAQQPSAAPQGGMEGAAYNTVPQVQEHKTVPRKSWISRVVNEFRTPLFVAIIMFVFSMPVVNFLFAHYAPSLVKSTGELTTIGLLVKCLSGGAAFWLLQRVVVPLLST